jgi:hypothetical protein
MVETAVEIARCEGCGADIRDASLFCYNCGASVSVVESEPVAEEAPPEHAVEAKGEDEIARPGERPALKSAASIRKQRRAFNRQPVKVSWEAPEGSPKAFVVTTIVLVLGAAVLLVLALYMR